MTWIATIPFEAATGRLRQLYERIAGPGSNVDNIMLSHSLRPHTMEGHMALYKAVLHHPRNRIPKWFLETLGVYVSLLNDCGYCVEHHFAGLRRLLDDPVRAAALRGALESGEFGQVFAPREAAALAYAAALTRQPPAATEAMVADLRGHGFDDGEILEINQVAAYFAYANRTVLGLGSSTEGDALGLSFGQSDDPDDWSHQ